MRDRIYKAKRKNWKELPKEKWWVEGAVFEGKENSYIITNVKVADEWEDSEIGADVIGYLVDPETICEPTGLTDKNGRKIFEGDIVEVCTFGFNSERFVTEVIFDKCAFRLKNGRNMFYFGQSDFTKMDDAKVIGNIFDNPELIGE